MPGSSSSCPVLPPPPPARATLRPPLPTISAAKGGVAARHGGAHLMGSLLRNAASVPQLARGPDSAAWSPSPSWDRNPKAAEQALSHLRGLIHDGKESPGANSARQQKPRSKQSIEKLPPLEMRLVGDSPSAASKLPSVRRKQVAEETWHKAKLQELQQRDRSKRQRKVEEQFQKVLAMQEQLNLMRQISSLGAGQGIIDRPKPPDQVMQRLKEQRNARQQRRKRFGQPGAAFRAGVLPSLPKGKAKNAEAAERWERTRPQPLTAVEEEDQEDPFSGVQSPVGDGEEWDPHAEEYGGDVGDLDEEQGAETTMELPAEEPHEIEKAPESPPAEPPPVVTHSVGECLSWLAPPAAPPRQAPTQPDTIPSPQSSAAPSVRDSSPKAKLPPSEPQITLHEAVEELDVLPWARRAAAPPKVDEEEEVDYVALATEVDSRLTGNWGSKWKLDYREEAGKQAARTEVEESAAFSWPRNAGADARTEEWIRATRADEERRAALRSGGRQSAVSQRASPARASAGAVGVTETCDVEKEERSATAAPAPSAKWRPAVSQPARRTALERYLESRAAAPASESPAETPRREDRAKEASADMEMQVARAPADAEECEEPYVLGGMLPQAEVVAESEPQEEASTPEATRRSPMGVKSVLPAELMSEFEELEAAIAQADAAQARRQACASKIQRWYRRFAAERGLCPNEAMPMAVDSGDAAHIDYFGGVDACVGLFSGRHEDLEVLPSSPHPAYAEVPAPLDFPTDAESLSPLPLAPVAEVLPPLGGSPSPVCSAESADHAVGGQPECGPVDATVYIDDAVSISRGCEEEGAVSPIPHRAGVEECETSQSRASTARGPTDVHTNLAGISAFDRSTTAVSPDSSGSCAAPSLPTVPMVPAGPLERVEGPDGLPVVVYNRASKTGRPARLFLDRSSRVLKAVVAQRGGATSSQSVLELDNVAELCRGLKGCETIWGSSGVPLEVVSTADRVVVAVPRGPNEEVFGVRFLNVATSDAVFSALSDLCGPRPSLDHAQEELGDFEEAAVHEEEQSDEEEDDEVDEALEVEDEESEEDDEDEEDGHEAHAEGGHVDEDDEEAILVHGEEPCEAAPPMQVVEVLFDDTAGVHCAAAFPPDRADTTPAKDPEVCHLLEQAAALEEQAAQLEKGADGTQEPSEDSKAPSEVDSEEDWEEESEEDSEEEVATEYEVESTARGTSAGAPAASEGRDAFADTLGTMDRTFVRTRCSSPPLEAALRIAPGGDLATRPSSCNSSRAAIGILGPCLAGVTENALKAAVTEDEPVPALFQVGGVGSPSTRSF